MAQKRRQYLVASAEKTLEHPNKRRYTWKFRQETNQLWPKTSKLSVQTKNCQLYRYFKLKNSKTSQAHNSVTVWGNPSRWIASQLFEIQFLVDRIL